MGSPQQVPWKSAEESCADHFQSHPGRRAGQRPERAPAPGADPDFAGQQPDPDGKIKRHKRAQGCPGQHRVARHGNPQEPGEGGQPEEKTCHIPDAKGIARGLALGAGQYQGGRDPREAGDAVIGECPRQEQAGTGGAEIAAPEKEFIQEPAQNQKPRIARIERRPQGCTVCGFPEDGPAGIDDDGGAGAAPHGEIGGGISGVIKAARPELCRQRLEFVTAAQVGFSIAGHHFVKQPHMPGYRQGHL